MRSLTIVGLGISLLLILTSPASADTDLGVCSFNGVTVSSDITVGDDGVGSSAAADFDSASDLRLVAVPTPSGVAIASATKLPAAGSAKDQVDGSLKAAFEYGSPIGSTGQDTLRLDASGTASAMNSTNSVGNQADATVTGEARAEFFIDIVAGTDCDTFLTMPEVRNLLPFEIFLELNVIMDPGPSAVGLATLPPGSPAQTVLLPEGHSFLIQLNYDYRVPFGIDPPFSFSYPIRIGAAPVPGLGMEGAIGVGLLLVIGGAVMLQTQRSKGHSARTP